FQTSFVLFLTFFKRLLCYFFPACQNLHPNNNRTYHNTDPLGRGQSHQYTPLTVIVPCKFQREPKNCIQNEIQLQTFRFSPLSATYFPIYTQYSRDQKISCCLYCLHREKRYSCR